MKLIIGLGNPGVKYKNTRHNVGFIALDHIKKTVEGFENFTLDNVSKSLLAKGFYNSSKIILAKPQTFMNNSGLAVRKLIDYFKLDPENDLLVIYDDIDLPLGTIRNKGKSSAGHRGMQSIIETLNTSKISRIRIGILNKEKGEIKDTASYVLQNFNDRELKILNDSFKLFPNLIKKFIV